MKIVLQEWMKNKKAFILIIITLIMNGIYSILSSSLIIKIRDALDNASDTVMFRTVIIIALANVIIGPLRMMLGKYATQHNLTEMSLRWHKKLTEADFQLFTKYSCSKVYTVGEFLWSCSTIMNQILYMCTCVVTIISTIAGMWILGGKLILPVIGLYGLSAFLFRYLFGLYEKIDDELHVFTKARNQEIENSINGFSEVRAFGEQDTHMKNMRKILTDMESLKLKKQGLHGFTTLSFEVVDFIGMILVLIYCLAQIRDGLMTPATAMSLVLYVFKIIDPLANILDFMENLSASTATAKDFKEIMDYVNHIQNGEINMEGFNDSIEINNLSFSYNDSSSVLKNINLKIKKGERIGIVGSSGNGKSTLAKLLLHFYEPKAGNICIDGIDIKEMTDESFRRLVGTVQQENNIFPGSIMSNITYGSKHSLENEIVEACKRARIYDFIMSLPEKFDTEVGPRGLKLSGGQKQRIALARLFLKNPDIIILDEATSALDNETETLIQDAIDELSGKTIITIAHRLSTIKNSDQIYVLDKNTIAEHGTHDELITQNGIYAAMQK